MLERTVLKEVIDSVNIADNIGAILAPYISQIFIWYHVKSVVNLSEISGKRFSVNFITRFIVMFKHQEGTKAHFGGTEIYSSGAHKTKLLAACQ